MRKVVLGLGLALLAACSTTQATDSGFTLHEWSVDGPAHLTAGTDAITIHNTGEYNHTLVITNDSGEVIAATGLVAPGTDAVLPADLGPGTYTFSCRIVAADDEGNLIDHYERGMYRTVTLDG
ncbi:MAG: hypothetical protein WB245_11815 [Acidimicrobiia bacterium]